MAFDPRTYYLTLLKEVTDELCCKMLRYMIDNDCIGEDNRVSRAHLASALLGKADERNDRKIRKAKEIIVKDMGILILSSSGTRGYYLAEYQEEVDAFVRENNNRIASLRQLNNVARSIHLPNTPPPNSQMSLFNRS